MGAQHLPGEVVRVVGEHRSTGERKNYLSNLPAEASLKQLAGAIKARCLCEQTHQQLKEELGLDHIEERSRAGLHWHALMTIIAYAFLQSRRLMQAGGGKRISGPPPQPMLSAIRTEILKIIQNLHRKHALIAGNLSSRKICQSSARRARHDWINLCAIRHHINTPFGLRLRVHAAKSAQQRSVRKLIHYSGSASARCFQKTPGAYRTIRALHK